jgi:hypothetical protein
MTDGKLSLNMEKAGMTGVDKERANKIIYEMSKNSKVWHLPFFEQHNFFVVVGVGPLFFCVHHSHAEVPNKEEKCQLSFF